MDSTILPKKKCSSGPLARFLSFLLYSFIYLFISLLNSTYITVQYLTVGFVPLCLLCLYMLMLYKSKFAVCHLRPRCPSSVSDPQRLAALHCLLVYMGNDPNLELKVQLNAGNELAGH